MTDELVNLRREAYRCGALFHGAMAKYFTDLNDDDVTAAAMAHTTDAASRAGADYNVALVALLRHLKFLPACEDVRIEAERAERTISILSFEIRRL